MAEATSSTLHVVPVTEDSWRIYRDVRLAALLDTPRAFASTYAGAAARDESAWLALLGSMRVWLAFEEDRPVGVIALSRDEELPEDEAYLIQMWVSSSARGRGVGDLLVSTVLDSAGEAGYSRVLLDVGEENLPAQRLYERHGFTRTGTTWDNPLYGGIREIGYSVRVDPGCRPSAASGTVDA